MQTTVKTDVTVDAMHAVHALNNNYIDRTAERCHHALEIEGQELTAEAVEDWCNSNPRPNRRPMRWPEVEEVKKRLGLPTASVKVRVESVDPDWGADVVVLEDGHHWWRGNRATLEEVAGLAVGDVLTVEECTLSVV